MWDTVNVSELVGKTFIKVEKAKDASDLYFIMADGTGYRMYHPQDCCENVYLEDVAGDLEDLVGSPIVSATEDTDEITPKDVWHDDCFKWTFYNIATAKGWVTLRWYGESNGYYGVGVDIEKVEM